MQSRHNQIRELLLQAEDGMTANEIAARLDVRPSVIRQSLKTVYGVYIDRWVAPKRGQYSAVYVCVEVPEDTPKPRKEK
jgi:predicted ArsR family transcriptional regulator